MGLRGKASVVPEEVVSDLRAQSQFECRVCGRTGSLKHKRAGAFSKGRTVSPVEEWFVSNERVELESPEAQHTCNACYDRMSNAHRKRKSTESPSRSPSTSRLAKRLGDMKKFVVRCSPVRKNRVLKTQNARISQALRPRNGPTYETDPRAWVDVACNKPAVTAPVSSKKFAELAKAAAHYHRGKNHDAAYNPCRSHECKGDIVIMSATVTQQEHKVLVACRLCEGGVTGGGKTISSLDPRFRIHSAFVAAPPLHKRTTARRDVDSACAEAAKDNADSAAGVTPAGADAVEGGFNLQAPPPNTVGNKGRGFNIGQLCQVMSMIASSTSRHAFDMITVVGYGGQPLAGSTQESLKRIL